MAWLSCCSSLRLTVVSPRVRGLLRGVPRSPCLPTSRSGEKRFGGLAGCLAVWPFGRKHAPRECATLCQPLSTLLLSLPQALGWWLLGWSKGHALYLQFSPCQQLFLGIGSGRTGGDLLGCSKGHALRLQFSLYQHSLLGLDWNPFRRELSKVVFHGVRSTSPPLECGNERTFCWNCPSCLRGGRNRFPSPGPARPPPRDISAGRDFTLRLSRNDWLLGGGLARGVEFIRIFIEVKSKELGFLSDCLTRPRSPRVCVWWWW